MRKWLSRNSCPLWIALQVLVRQSSRFNLIRSLAKLPVPFPNCLPPVLRLEPSIHTRAEAFASRARRGQRKQAPWALW